MNVWSSSWDHFWSSDQAAKDDLNSSSRRVINCDVDYCIVQRKLRDPRHSQCSVSRKKTIESKTTEDACGSSSRRPFKTLMMHSAAVFKSNSFSILRILNPSKSTCFSERTTFSQQEIVVFQNQGRSQATTTTTPIGRLELEPCSSSLGRLLNRAIAHRSLKRSVIRSLERSIDWSVTRSLDLWIARSLDHLLYRSIARSNDPLTARMIPSDSKLMGFSILLVDASKFRLCLSLGLRSNTFIVSALFFVGDARLREIWCDCISTPIDATLNLWKTHCDSLEKNTPKSDSELQKNTEMGTCDLFFRPT